MAWVRFSHKSTHLLYILALSRRHSKMKYTTRVFKNASHRLLANNTTALNATRPKQYLALVLKNMFAAVLAAGQSSFPTLDATFGEDTLWVARRLGGK